MNKQGKDANQGEGDKLSARRYDTHVREFIDEGKVNDAAKDARTFVDRNPAAAKMAENRAKRGPHHIVSLDELLAKGRTAIDRVRPIVERAVGKLRTRFSKK
jgi:hypothetical protein